MIRFVLVLFISSLIVCLYLQPVIADAQTGIFNVRDYGAKGDGSTDDTEAIKSALNAAQSASFSQQSTLGVYFTGGPSVVFPGGVYKISDEIGMGGFCVRGEYQATLLQTNPDKNILTSGYAWQYTIQNITFMGGKNQIEFHNPNLDTGQIVIDHCRFYNASGFAVYTDVLSTKVDIKDCEFVQNAQTWFNKRSDQASMRDCWITTDNRVRDKAAIEHRGGRLTIENLCGVPLTGASGLRWIDNYGTNLTLKQCRFGAEGGGFTTVYNFIKYAESTYGNTIYFDDCLISANASYNANGAVLCKDIPNSIVFSKCQFIGGQPVILDKKIDLNNYFINTSPKLLCYKVENCTGELLEDLPAGLRKPVVKTASSTKKILTEKEAKEAVKRDLVEWKTKAEPDVSGGVDGTHRQQTSSEKYITLTPTITGYMDATAKKNSEYLVLATAGTDTIFVFKQKPDWAHITARIKIDLDKYPYLTWKQKTGTVPASYAVKVIDMATGEMQALMNETFGEEFDYHAVDLRKAFGSGGVRELEVRFYPLGWGMKSINDSDYFYAEPGQYGVMDFLRMEME